MLEMYIKCSGKFRSIFYFIGEFERRFTDIGKKIKGLAKTIFGIGMCISFAVGIIFIVLLGAESQLIGSYGGGFVHYVFTTWWIYAIAVVILLIDLSLFCNEIEMVLITIGETIVMFIIYMVLGCKGYSAYGEWQEMLWRCSFCKKWNPTYDRYCKQCEFTRTGNDVVKMEKK